MEDQHYPHHPEIEEEEEEELEEEEPEIDDDGDLSHHHPQQSQQPQQPGFCGIQQPMFEHANYPSQFEPQHEPEKGRPISDRKRKTRKIFRIVAYSFVLLLTGFIACGVGYEASVHRSVTSTPNLQEAVFSKSSIWSSTTNRTRTAHKADSTPQYITIKNVTLLGPQHSTSVTNVSRDGGSSVLINGNIVWLYDDTASRNRSGSILSFLSNTAAYSSEPNGSVTLVRDFGVNLTDPNDPFKLETGILAKDVVQNGAWIPFTKEEAEVNKQDPAQKRVAIWPGTAATPINRTNAILFAPLVNVYGQANFSNEYQAKGMTLVSITAPESGPVAHREVDQIVPNGQVPFGGFATLIGSSTDPKDLIPKNGSPTPPKVIYMFGIAERGIQLARVLLQDVADYAKWTFFNPQQKKFIGSAPALNESSTSNIYLNGSFSSGNIFYNPYFGTFLMVYFKNNGDSTFYFRYLDLAKANSGGKPLGAAVNPTFVEYLSEYEWSAEYVMYKSPPGPGGYNYAGTVHPEFFNRRYYSGLEEKEVNPWYGQTVAAPPKTGEGGQHLMLSWTSQLQGGANTGVYQITMAVVEFNVLTDRIGFYGSTMTTPGHSPTGTPLPTATPSSLPTSGSVSSIHLRRHGLSLWTTLCKLGVAAAATVWLAMVV